MSRASTSVSASGSNRLTPTITSSRRSMRAWRRAKRFVGLAYDVVVGILRGQRYTRGLAMRAQHQRLWFFRAEILHDLRPQGARGSQLRDFHEEIHANAEKE